ncbi:MAG TPA: hypothetical protein VI423_05450, partial [Paenisporosarcina sp.]|nr:hypothetical protein [Paenisporosarcina sp.]
VILFWFTNESTLYFKEPSSRRCHLGGYRISLFWRVSIYNEYARVVSVDERLKEAEHAETSFRMFGLSTVSVEIEWRITLFVSV